MFEKKDKKLVTSDMYESDLPSTLNDEEHLLLSQLLRLTQRIASVFYIQTVYGQLDLTQSNVCNLVMTNNGSRVIEGVRENENKRAIAFLLEFGGVLTTKPSINPLFNSSVVTFETTKLETVLKKLALLKDLPSPTLGSSIRAMW
jgi:hypothetical protein